MTRVHLQCVFDFVFGQVHRVGYLVDARPPLVLLLKLVEHTVDFVHAAHLVERQPHDAALFGDGLQDALPDPPHGVGDKLEAARLVKLLGGLDESHVALVDEVGQAEALILILFGHRDNKAEIGLSQFFQRVPVSFPYSLSKFHFLFYGDQFFMSNLLQVLVQ